MMCVCAKAMAHGYDMSDDSYDDGMKDSVFGSMYQTVFLSDSG